MIETHFWGQEGAAREFSASIWKLPDWPFADFEGRIPKDKRASYIDAALSGIKWRLDTSRERLALTHFDTIKVPGGTGFLAATQVFDRALSPNQDALVQMRKQLQTAKAILSSTKVFNRPESIPKSGTYEAVAVLPPEESSEPVTWLVSGTDTDDQLLEAIRLVVRLRHSNLSVVFRPYPMDASTEGKLGSTAVHALGALPQLLEQDLKAYDRELELTRQREEEARTERERITQEKELARAQEQFKSSQTSPPIRWSFVGGVLLVVLAAIGLGYYLLSPESCDMAVVYQDLDKSEKGGFDKKCDDPKAMNFLDVQNECRYRDFIARLDNLENGWFEEDLHWQEHRFEWCERIYRFSTNQVISPEDIEELEEVFNTELDSRGSVQIRPSNNEDSVDIRLRFDSFPVGEDRIILSVPKHFDFPFGQIKLNILHEDRDTDSDGFPASQDKFPFQGGRCDGVDSNGFGVDDAIFEKNIETVRE
jgi:hypothetical protein